MFWGRKSSFRFTSKKIFYIYIDVAKDKPRLSFLRSYRFLLRLPYQILLAIFFLASANFSPVVRKTKTVIFVRRGSRASFEIGEPISDLIRKGNLNLLSRRFTLFESQKLKLLGN